MSEEFKFQWGSINEKIQEEFLEYVFYRADGLQSILERELKFKFGSNLMLTVEYLPPYLKNLPSDVVVVDSHRGEEVVPARRLVHEKLVARRGEIVEAHLNEILAAPRSLVEDTHPYPEESLEFYIGDSEIPLSLYELAKELRNRG